ncbi:MAG TPA: MATE family efflux transporter [Spirochaetota bacterium]|nr:MATE family efflux transporter [Spirochaetota bacterium]HPJ44202.1 MATE family efflux transporter [Spirochaetota bacterium]HRX49053.1 MATE family efflux transporter [Spirochaetota bacterium]
MIQKIKSIYQGKGGVAEMLAIALPMIISTACDGVMTFTDRLFLAKLGPEQMNAAMGGGVMLQTLMFFFVGLVGYSTALSAQYYGSGKKENAPVTAFQAMIIVAASYPLILSLVPFAKYLFTVMSIPESQIGYQCEYIDILALGALPALTRHALGCYFSGIGRTKVVMFATITAMVVNVALDYILIFGNFGAPALGIKGAAAATICGSISAVLILVSAYFSREHRGEFRVMKSFRFDFTVMKQLIYFGYPAGIEFFLNFLAFSMMIFLFHSQGDSVATASTIMFNWDFVAFIPLLGIEIAVTSLVGRYMGAGDPDTAHRSAMSGIRTGIWYSCLMMVAFLFFPEFLVNVFRPEAESSVFNSAFPMTVTMIRIASVYLLAEVMMVAFIGALRGAGDTHWTMMASVAFHWFTVPLLYVMFKWLNMSAVSVWSAIVVCFMCFCVVLFFRYRGGKWREIKVV